MRLKKKSDSKLCKTKQLENFTVMLFSCFIFYTCSTIIIHTAYKPLNQLQKINYNISLTLIKMP
jgi:hypothetical protein